MDLSADQTRAWSRLEAILKASGIDLPGASLLPDGGPQPTVAVLGRAGSGKTLLLAELVRALTAAGVETISADYESRKTRSGRTLAVLAPTNKAASVLRGRGVPATTIHRILYTPLYHPDYEAIAEWLTGKGDRPKVENLSDAALDRAFAFFQQHPSIPGALASAGLRGSDFIRGWKRRDEPLDIGLIDEASMLDERQYADLRELFSTLVLFGDPAQLAPVGGGNGMVFDGLPADAKLALSRVHRQASDSPILDLADALGDPGLGFEDFERMVERAAARDARVVVSGRVDAGTMARSPVLVWRNATRVRLIQAFRTAFGAPAATLLPGEPLVCDGIELPLRHRKKRMDLEARGLTKGAQVIYIGPSARPGFARLYVVGAEDPRVGVASIIQLEAPGVAEPQIVTAASMGAVFLHGAAVTIHKAQGSQWPVVQVFAPDLWTAAQSGRAEAGIALWKRLAYVAVTRAEERLVWVTRYALARPTAPLGIDDLPAAPPKLELTGEA
jgi:exodeoxyribonuclease-5